MRRLKRLIRILHVYNRYRLDTLIDQEYLPSAAKVFMRMLPGLRLGNDKAPRGERLRDALIELGPIFVKFGQLLSTRRDLIPDDIGDELAKLQDQVPPFPSEQAIALVEKSLGKPVSELFAEFDPEPIASASVAQVHAAQLLTGERVVVKVIRPGIEPVIRKDISLLYTLARLLLKLIPDVKRLRPLEVVRDYERTLLDELDLLREAGSTSQLRRNFIGSGLLYVPRVYWEYSHKQVMVQERIHGIPVSDIESLRARNVDFKVLAERGVEIFFTQVFRDSFFHADMHPGNIFVDATCPGEPQYIGIDCGIIGSLEPVDQEYLARNLLAFFRRDYRQVAQLHIDSGWVPEDTRLSELESAIRTVCEPIFEKPLKDISFGLLLVRLFQTAQRFNMEVQPQLVLLQKTLLNIEGLGRQLYPDLDLWSTAQPFLEEWMKERISPQGVLKRLRDHGADMLLQGPELPVQAMQAIQRISEDQRRSLDANHHAQRRFQKHLRLAGGVMVSAAAVYGLVPELVISVQWQVVALGVTGLLLISRKIA